MHHVAPEHQLDALVFEHVERMTRRVTGRGHRTQAGEELLRAVEGAHLARRDVRRKRCPRLLEEALLRGGRSLLVRRIWTFRHEGKTTSIRVKGRLSVNEGEVAQALAVDGAGLIYKSVWEIGTHLQAGRLVPVRSDFRPSKAGAKPTHDDVA